MSYRPFTALFAVGSLLITSAAARAQSVYFEGLEHRALGQANLDIAGDNLQVWNIGSSGQDGVRILATEAESVRVELRFDPALIAPGASYTLHARGVRDGVPSSWLQALSFLRTQTGLALLPNFSALGSSLYSAYVYDDVGNVVYSGADLDSGVLELQPTLVVTIQVSATSNGRFDLTGFEDLLVLTPNGPVSASRIVLEPQTPNFMNLVLTEMHVRAAGVPGFRIFSERLGLFGDRAHRALGDARLDSDLAQGQLVVSNIGASGDDGVVVELDDDEHQDWIELCTIWSPISEPVGAQLRMEALGTIDAVPDTPYSSLSVTKTSATVFDLEAAYTTVTPVSMHIKVKFANIVVTSYSFHGSSGVVARTSSTPTVFTMGRSTTTSWETPTQLRTPSGAVFTADEMIVTPVDPIACHELIGCILIIGSNMSELRIEGEVIVSPPEIGVTYCSPAIPHSGGLAARIAAFGSALRAEDDVYLRATDLPVNQFGYFLASQTPGAFVPPGSSGVLCLSGTIGRYAGQIGSSGPAGVRALTVDLDAIPTFPAHSVQVGETWNFQLWFRDFGPTSNFTDAVRITFH